MAATTVTIKAIDASAVHRIQSGQVIVNLCSVAKELVENSLDAGATSIEVRFKNQGLDAIEVQDNGSGIAPHNYASLALKHHTSKLARFDDLDSLQTFGFRGEALSSMCALSRFAVTTCLAADVPRGARLHFAASGQLAGPPAVVAAQKGTTVSVEDLFWNLPVRRRELQRNIKREWTRVVTLLNQYACIQTGVKFTVSQQPTKGRRVVLFATKGNPATRDNIINVFGAKTMAGLLALDLVLDMVSARPRLGAGSGSGTTKTQVRVRGFVSRPAQGHGRQTPDRQMFYVNGRPCKLPQFAQLFGEVYRAYNSAQSPFIFADIQLDTHLYDVNVSPDKQTILLHDQGRMLDTLRESLVELFEKQDITVPISQLASTRKLSAPKRAPPQPVPDEQSEDEGQPTTALPSQMPTADSDDESLFVDDRHNVAAHRDDSDAPEPASVGDADATDSSLLPAPPAPAPPAPASPPAGRLGAARRTAPPVYPRPPKSLSSDAATAPPGDDTASAIMPSPKRQKLAAMSSNAANRTVPSGASLPRRKATAPLPSFGGRLTHMFSARARGSVGSDKDEEEDDEEEELETEVEEEEEAEEEEEEEVEEEEEEAEEEEAEDENEAEEDEEAEDGDKAPPQDLDRETSTTPNLTPKAEPTPAPQPMEDIVQDGDGETGESEYDGDGDARQHSPAAETELELDECDRRSRLFMRAGGAKKRYETLRLVQVLQADGDLPKMAKRVPPRRARPLPTRNTADATAAAPEPAGGLDAHEAVAEAKLALTIVKSDFARMRVVGQFNLGFILAVRDAAPSNADANAGTDDSTAQKDDELFIIDQHASDEKYNFERLQAATVVQSQRLVQPKRLELTAVEEEIVVENTAALAANGFEVDVEVDGSAPVGSRCRLRTLPLSRETTFDLGDLEELIALLGDHHQREATAVVRPAKVRKMFAMRACRSSIMIGTALSRRQMAAVLAHMGEMDKPWNCPHGRPTMRHLCSLGAAWDATRRTWDDDDNDELSGSGGHRGAEWARFLKKRRRADGRCRD